MKNFINFEVAKEKKLEKTFFIPSSDNAALRLHNSQVFCCICCTFIHSTITKRDCIAVSIQLQDVASTNKGTLPW